MSERIVYHYDAFTETPNMGNPAGIVIDADHMTDEEMQAIAYKVGFNETAFVLKSNKADLRIRYFTPGHEMNLCGHATIAALYCLKTKGLLDNLDKVTIETKACVLSVRFLEKDKRLYIVMEQAPPVFKDFGGSAEDIATALGLKIDDIDNTMPIVYGNTGIWTLLLPIKKLKAFSNMTPQNKMFPSILREIPHCSVHPFCMDTVKSYAHMHARHFSSPFSGTVEDPVTGTASGVMGAYYLTYIAPDLDTVELIIEQGQEANRDGEVYVHGKRYENVLNISISGTAVFTKEIYIQKD